MSALRVSRRAAEESDRIAAFQSLAAMADFPAAYSGSSCPSFGASSVGSARVVPGSRARPRPSRPTEILTPITSLLAGQPLLRLAQLGPIAVRVPREPGELLEVLARLLRVSGELGGLGDRKSTRLNSSHLVISYAVFCLKKKKNTRLHHSPIAPSVASSENALH